MIGFSFVLHTIFHVSYIPLAIHTYVSSIFKVSIDLGSYSFLIFTYLWYSKLCWVSFAMTFFVNHWLSDTIITRYMVFTLIGLCKMYLSLSMSLFHNCTSFHSFYTNIVVMYIVILTSLSYIVIGVFWPFHYHLIMNLMLFRCVFVSCISTRSLSLSHYAFFCVCIAPF